MTRPNLQESMPSEAAEARFHNTCVRRSRRELSARSAGEGVAVQSRCITAGGAGCLGLVYSCCRRGI